MMKSYGLFGFLGFISLSLVFALPARAEDTPHVFISEINWAGSQISTADEWIELVNLGQTSVDLSHYVLTGVATSGGAIEIAEGTTLGPGSTLLIANYALGDPKTTLLISPDLVTTAISLPNTALDILLTTPEGLVIDNYTDTGTPDFGLSNPATSIERNLTTLAWQSSTQSLSLSATTQLGTPGSVSLSVVANEVPTTPGVVDPAPAISDPIITETPVIETPTQSEVIESPVPDELPAPCTQVVLENESLAASEPVATPAPETIETAPALEPSVPAIEPSVPPATPENPEVNTPSVQKITPGDLVLNELVSDPLDGIEWVELLNLSSSSLDLSGSTLKDAGAHITTLPSQDLPAGGLLVIENPNGNLNNSSESLTLFDAAGTELDALTYGTTEIPAPQDGESLARTSDGAWLITSATRNAQNVFATELDVAPTINDNDPLSTNVYDTTTNPSDSPVLDPGTSAGPVETPDDSGSTAAEPVHRIVAIAKSVVSSPSGASGTTKSKKSTAQTVITGTVVALPDTFGKQIMFLEGHEIYFNAADWPVLALGDVVQMSGTDSTNDGAPRLKLSSAEAIVITGHVELAPTPVDGAELGSVPHGSLISIAGRVTGKNGNELSVTTDDGTSITVLGNKRTGVSWSSFQSGNVIVTGIVKHTTSGTTLAVRSNDDVHFTPDATLQAPTTTKTKTNKTPIVGGGLLTGSVGALGTWYVRSRKGLLSWLPF